MYEKVKLLLKVVILTNLIDSILTLLFPVAIFNNCIMDELISNIYKYLPNLLYSLQRHTTRETLHDHTEIDLSHKSL